MKIVFLLFTLLSFSTEIKGLHEECVTPSKEELINKLSDFSQYHKIDGDGYKFLKISDTLSINVMDMIESKVVKSQKEDQVETNILKIRLRPLPNQTNLSSDLYPKFYLQCQKNKKEFTLNCKLRKDLPHFALDDFSLKLSLFSKNKNCNLNKTFVSIDYNADINDQEYSKIKTEALDQMLGKVTLIKKIADKLFDPKEFFDSYWKNFFKKWLKD